MICEPKKISEMTLTCKLLCKDLVPIVLEGENKFILMKDLIRLIVASIGDGDGVDALSIAMYAKNLAEQANANSNLALKDLAVALAYATKAYKLACLFENRLSLLEENYLFLETLEETINNLQRLVSINTLNILKLFNSKVLRITPEENSNNIVYQFYMDDLLVGEIEVPKYKLYTGGQNIRINGNNVISVYGLHKVANTGNYYDLENLPDLTDFVTRSEFEQCCNEVKRRLKVLEDCCALMHSTFTVTLNLTHIHPTTAYTSTIENGGTFIIGLAPDTNYNNPVVSWAPSNNLSLRTVITPNNGIYKVENITQDITIIGGATEVLPEPVPTYTITYSLGGGISYNTQVSNVVQSGGSYSNEFTLDTGYTNLLASWKGTDSLTHNITLGNNNEFTINNITLNITIIASADAPEGTTYTLFITPKELLPTDLTIVYNNNTTITNTGDVNNITPGSNWTPDSIETNPPTYDVYFEIYNGQTYQGIISKEDLLGEGISVNASYILKWYLETKPTYKIGGSGLSNEFTIPTLGTVHDYHTNDPYNSGNNPEIEGHFGHQSFRIGEIWLLDSLTGQYIRMENITDIRNMLEITSTPDLNNKNLNKNITFEVLNAYFDTAHGYEYSVLVPFILLDDLDGNYDSNTKDKFNITISDLLDVIKNGITAIQGGFSPVSIIMNGTNTANGLMLDYMFGNELPDGSDDSCAENYHWYVEIPAGGKTIQRVGDNVYPGDAFLTLNNTEGESYPDGGSLCRGDNEFIPIVKLHLANRLTSDNNNPDVVVESVQGGFRVKYKSKDNQTNDYNLQLNVSSDQSWLQIGYTGVFKDDDFDYLFGDLGLITYSVVAAANSTGSTRSAALTIEVTSPINRLSTTYSYTISFKQPSL